MNIVPGIEVSNNPDNYRHFLAVIDGPKDTPYEGKIIISNNRILRLLCYLTEIYNFTSNIELRIIFFNIFRREISC